MLVDLVGNNPQSLGRGPLADLRNLLGAVNRAGGVGRGNEEQDLGPVRHRGLKLLDGHEVALLGTGEDLNRHAAGKADGLRVGGPERGGDDDFVARIHQGCERVVDGLLTAIGHQDLGRVNLVARVPQGLLRDGLLKLGQAARGGVTVVLRLAGRFNGCLDDVVGGGEVWFAGTETNHGTTRGLQCLGLGVNGKGGGLGNGGDSL